MANTLAQLLSETGLGEEQTSRNLTLVPLMATWTGQGESPREFRRLGYVSPAAMAGLVCCS